MDPGAIASIEFRVRFAVEAGEHGVIAYAPLHAAIAAALGLGSGVTPRYTVMSARTSSPIRPGDGFEGLTRVNGVRGVTVDGQKIAMISYSFYLTRQRALVLWSADLDVTSHPAHRKPSELWFRDGERPVLLTDELRASVRAIAPKKPRAASPRV